MPNLEGELLEAWCFRSLQANFRALYDTHHEYNLYVIRDAGITLARNLGVDLPYSCGIDVGEGYQVLTPRPVHIVIRTAVDDRDQLLNIIDCLLASRILSESEIEELRSLLRHGRSAWQVSHDESALALRVPLEEEASFRQTVAGDYSASQHLTAAWDAAWRRDRPSPIEAFDGAVKAIESLLAPIAIPKHPTPTLGKVVKALQDKPEKWDTRFRGEETVTALAAMLDELWRTQVRHHKSDYLENTLEEAQDAVTIAVAVVGLCRRGFLERVEDYTPEEEAEDLAIAEAALERYQSGNMKTVPYEEVVADWVADESST